ncbi:porin [Ferrimonas pelagia]|uniref:Porin n=1 Tax=Ferrimonas pelagia TaxID=1177826 RepID=A0ABP9F2I7_9GAMM
MRTAALCLSITIVAFPALSLGLYDDEINALSVGGHAGISLVNSDGDTRVADSSSRIRFTFNRQLPNDWQAEARMEWGFNLVDSGNNLQLSGDALQSQREGQFLFNRLGYLAFNHDKFGSLSIGKQWSVYYDVAANTDNFILTGGLASGVYNFGTDGGLSGTGRADSAIQYRNELYGLQYALQYQAKTEGTVGVLPPPECNVTEPPAFCDELNDFSVDYDDSWGGSVRYRFHALTFGVGYNRGNFESVARGQAKDEAVILGITYGDLYQPGLYAGANYAKTENHELDHRNRVFDGDGYELMVNYTFDNALTLVSGVNWLESSDSTYEDENGKFKRLLYVLGAHYQWGDMIRLYVEGKIDDSEFGSDNGSDENLIGVGARFYF